MSKNLVSIILPVFNGEKYIESAVRSILNQTHENIELIVINDGSTDATLDICSRLSTIDKRIVLISRDNQGLVKSLNEGISKAKGDYIARMDADDVSLPSRIEKQLKVITEDGVEFCFTSVDLIDEKDKQIGRVSYTVSKHVLKAKMLVSCCFYHPTVMFSRKIIEELYYDESYYLAEDYELWSRLINKGYKATVIKSPLLKYRVHNNSVSQEFSERQLSVNAKVLCRNFNEIGVIHRYETLYKLSHVVRYHNSFSFKEFLILLRPVFFSNPMIAPFTKFMFILILLKLFAKVNRNNYEY